MSKKVEKPDDEWMEELSWESYCVTRKKGTEKPFSGKLWNHWERGIYRCVCCGQELFRSASKFDAGCGWPSFFEPIDAEALAEATDTSHNMVRTEVLCRTCDAHLGHVFEDGPPPTGMRYCINSASLYFDKSGSEGE